MSSTPRRVTVPVLVTVKEYATRSPARPVAPVSSAIVLSTLICGAWGAVGTTLSGEAAPVVLPSGSVPVTMAVLRTTPASRSACVTV